jgi:hypothetical protein
VVVDRVRRHVQLACDLTIREAFGDQLCHRPFGVGQASPAGDERLWSSLTRSGALDPPSPSVDP